jgi:hypothetical protein
MQRWITPIIFASFVIAAAFGCGKKDSAIELTAAVSEKLPPRGAASDAPEFVRSLSLLYPQAEIYRVDNRILQKTNHSLKDIISYYESSFKKRSFLETARLEQSGGALLQYERSAKDVKELISVDVSKLPYAENYLIRIGRSEVDYSRGGGK